MRMVGAYFVMSLFPALLAIAADPVPISPAEAAKKVNEKVTVELLVKSVGGRDTRYLNSEEDFKSATNFTIAITKDAVAKFKKAGIEDSGTHFKGKNIRVTGVVTLNSDKPRITVEETEQITIVEKEKSNE